MPSYASTRIRSNKNGIYAVSSHVVSIDCRLVPRGAPHTPSVHSARAIGSGKSIATSCHVRGRAGRIRYPHEPMLGAIRQLAERVKRRERVALLLVGLCSGIGLATALTGRSAFLERPCSTFHRPDSTESRCVDRIAVIAGLETGAPVQAVAPPRLDPPVADAIAREHPGPPPGPLGWLLDGPPVSLRGPPSGRVVDVGRTGETHLARRNAACLHMTIGSSGSS